MANVTVGDGNGNGNGNGNGTGNGTGLGWFPTSTQDVPGWRLDVVTLLAVIGENSIAEHWQVISASPLCLLPRIVPAPQGLLRPTRPARLPEVRAKMVGVYSGVVLDSVGFFANIIRPLNELKAHAFHVLEIKYRPESVRPAPTKNLVGRLLGRFVNTVAKKGNSTSPSGADTERSTPVAEAAAAAAAAASDLEREGGFRNVLWRRFTNSITSDEKAKKADKPKIPLKRWAPIHLLSLFSFLLTLAILVASILWRDGAAVLAVSLLSAVGSITGYASRWQPVLMGRANHNKPPAGDVVIRTREGAFILVKCEENVARELFSGTEECDYFVKEDDYRTLMGISTVLLMVSVVLLGNCNWNAQVFIGASYIVLNGLYWGLGLVNKTRLWDLSRYVLDKDGKTPEDARKAEEGDSSFTRTLWYTIRETKEVAWVERSLAAPTTEKWKQWLEEAKTEAKNGNAKWDAVGRKDHIFGGCDDDPEQQAPLQEVQPPAESST